MKLALHEWKKNHKEEYMFKNISLWLIDTKKMFSCNKWPSKIV